MLFAKSSLSVNNIFPIQNLSATDEKGTYIFLQGFSQSVFHKYEGFVDQFDSVDLRLSLDLLSQGAPTLREFSSINRRL